MDEMWVGFLVPVSIFVCAASAGIVAMVLKGRQKDRIHRERMFMAEKGLEIPPDLYEPRQAKAVSEYRTGRAWLIVLGVLMISIGLGVMIALTVQEGIEHGIGGLVAMFIGVSFLISERLIAKRVVNDLKNSNGGSIG